MTTVAINPNERSRVRVTQNTDVANVVIGTQVGIDHEERVDHVNIPNGQLKCPGKLDTVSSVGGTATRNPFGLESEEAGFRRLGYESPFR